MTVMKGRLHPFLSVFVFVPILAVLQSVLDIVPGSSPLSCPRAQGERKERIRTASSARMRSVSLSDFLKG